MPGTIHRVRRAVFDLTCRDQTTAFKARKRLEEIFRGSIAQILEQAFDSYSPNGQAHRIERIEIDLGILDLDRMDDEGIRELVRNQLRKRFATLRRDETVAVSHSSSPTEALFHFLERGQLPWDAPVRNLSELEQLILDLDETAMRELVSRLMEIFHSASISTRFSTQFSLEFFLQIVRRLRPASWPVVKRLAEEWSVDLARSEGRTTILRAVVATAREPKKTLEHALRREIEETGASFGDVVEIAEQRDEQAGTSERRVLYTGHAGIVLLHPVLARFFQTLKLLDDAGKFRGREAQIRSVHLLYHLATGLDTPEEHSLILEKVVCGYPLEAPVPRELDLTTDERQESVALLEAVIEHWGKLKHTSPEGLREGFLQRDGRLEYVDGTWELNVERRGIDVLLAALPWSLYRIKLPWMPSGLLVEWV